MSYSDRTQYDANVDHSDCHGCGLCTLVCPVWQHKADVRYTPYGLAKSLQANSKLDSQYIMNCILCGACSSVCPQNIDLYQLMLQARENTADIDASTSEQHDKTDVEGSIPTDTTPDTTILLASPALRCDESTLSRVINCLSGTHEVMLSDDCGDDIFEQLRKGERVSPARLQTFLKPLQAARSILTDNGLVSYKLRTWMPQKNIESIGVAISKLDRVRKNLGNGDFYIIQSSEYNTNHASTLPHYTALQNESGCELNLDLHRLALPTGSRHTADADLTDFDTAAQVQWLLDGRRYQRIVAEDLVDVELLAGLTDRPVLHVSELSA